MYLKSLELFGFKTFADRTTLEFGPGITGVVGPNGSGKSNIADALLFVLGEQSTKSIRTNQLTDVIFNGNEGRKALGIAEVTLVLDNSDESLALPYSEVAVTRRTHRSGESDYFINRTRCRLRDIQELFLDTGLGKSAYALIGQNEVDRILSLRAEDRRTLFEEAAGTAKYRGRRNETLRKLDQTQDHLTRIHDIQAEVQSQLEPLRKQAEQAKEYRRVVERHREVAVSVLVSEIAQARATIGKSEHEAFVVRTDLERLEVETAELESRSAEIRGQQEDLESRIEAAQRRNGMVQAAISRAESQTAVSSERIRSCQGRRELLQRECAGIEERLAEIREQVEAAGRRRGELSQRLEIVGPRELELQESLKALQAEFDRLTSNLAAADEERRTEAARKATLETELVNLKGQRRDAEERLREAEEAIERLSLQERQQEERCAEADGELDHLASKEQELGDAVERAREAQTDLQGKIEDVQEKRSRAQAQMGSADARLKSLEEIEKSGGHLPRGIKTLLAARGDGELGGVVGTVSEVIGVPPELERAIAAALGEWSRALVVETTQGAWAAVQLLREKRGGYAMMLPLDFAAAHPTALAPPETVSRASILGRASDLVSYHPRRKALVERLLGRVIVVRDRTSASAALGALAGRGTVVSIDGDRWDADGAIGGGSEPTAVESPISLATAITRAESDRDEAESQIARLDSELESLRRALDRAKNEGNQAEGEFRQCVADIQSVSTSAAVGQERLQGLQRQRQEQEGRRNALHVMIDELDRRAADRAEKLDAFAGAETIEEPVTNEDAISSLAARTEEVRNELSDVRMERQQLQSDLDASATELERLPVEQERGRARVGEIRKELKGLDESEAGAEAETTKARAELDEAKQRGQEVMEELRRLAEERHAAVTSLAEAERLAKDARSRMPQLREALSAHEIRRARAEETRATAEGRLAEEFDLTVEAAEAVATKIEKFDEARAELRALRSRLAQISDVNLSAEAEWERLAERDRFLGEQKADLERARDNLREIIAEIDNATKVQFLEAFNAIAQEFQRVFRYFFDGGSTQLVLTDPDNLLETGVDIVVKTPGRARQPLAAMSGGERALTATSLLFAMLRVRPSPFCVLDEIDAALDEANTERLARLLGEWTDQTQFIVITHAPGTMQGCDRLYGVTMQERGVSCCLSIELEDAEAVLDGRPARSAREVLYQPRSADGPALSGTAP